MQVVPQVLRSIYCHFSGLDISPTSTEANQPNPRVITSLAGIPAYLPDPFGIATVYFCKGIDSDPNGFPAHEKESLGTHCAGAVNR